MNLQTQAVRPTEANGNGTQSARLEPMLVRLPRGLAEQLRELARVTRIRQSDYLREAVADLLAKYSHLRTERTGQQ